MHRIEVERLLVLQRGERREARDGGGEEGQGDEDAAQHPDLPDGPPGLPERGGGLDREVDGVRDGAGVAQRRGLAALGGDHLLAQLELLVAAPGRLAQAQADDDHEHDGHGEEEEGARQVKTAARPAPSRTPTMAPMLMPERWAE